MYPSQNAKHGPLKLNQFVHQKYLDHNIMLKTIQTLCYNKNGHPFNMTSPFLVDNILHQQKASNFHSQYLENYIQGQNSRENSPELDESKNDDENRIEESIDETKIEQDDDSKSRDEDEPPFVKNEAQYNEFYQQNAEKEVLNIPTLARRCPNCGAFDCSPFACRKSGIRRLEELEKRLNLHHYQDNSGDESTDLNREGKGYTTDIARSSEQKKPMLKFSVSAILGEREDRDEVVKANGISGE